MGRRGIDFLKIAGFFSSYLVPRAGINCAGSAAEWRHRQAAPLRGWGCCNACLLRQFTARILLEILVYFQLSYVRDKSRASALSGIIQTGFAYGAKLENVVGVGLFLIFLSFCWLCTKVEHQVLPSELNRRLYNRCVREKQPVQSQRGASSPTLARSAPLPVLVGPVRTEGESQDEKKFWQLPRDI